MVPKISWWETKDGDEEQIVNGFMIKPVFRYDDTAGKPLKIETLKLPEFSLIDSIPDLFAVENDIYIHRNLDGFYMRRNTVVFGQYSSPLP